MPGAPPYPREPTDYGSRATPASINPLPPAPHHLSPGQQKEVEAIAQQVMRSHLSHWQARIHHLESQLALLLLHDGATTSAAADNNSSSSLDNITKNVNDYFDAYFRGDNAAPSSY